MNSNQKGKAGEREAASFLRDQGFDCRRGVQYCGGSESPDVVGMPGTHIEVKRTERLQLRDAVAQAEGDCGGKPWVVLHRWNNGKWLAIMTAEEWCRLKREDLPTPVTVTNFDKPMTEPIHIISLGAGVQSSTMALMAAAGEITPMPVAAIFADTQAEPKSVYVWLDWLEKQLPFPVHRVTRGNLTDESLRLRNNVKKGSGLWAKSLIPAFILNKDGSKGIMGRQCTYNYKVEQLEKASRRIAQVKRGQKTVAAIQWIGISLDEIYRMKPSRVPWLKHRWPLVDMGMKRHDCLKWMERKGFPKPPRSACVYCPFHSDSEWKRLKDLEPEEFAKAVKYERDLQAVKAQTDYQSGKPFLHASLNPLSEVDFSTEEERGQLNMFNNECEGLCGV